MKEHTTTNETRAYTNQPESDGASDLTPNSQEVEVNKTH